MTDEPVEPEPEAKRSTPARSMRGAAEDLSSLFGEEAYEADRSSALGPPRSAGGERARFGPSLDGVSRRMSYLEAQLAEAVSRIQGVDRHLATTYQALQTVLARLVESPEGPGSAGDLEPVADRLEAIGREMTNATHLIGDRIERLTRRLSAVEVALVATADRLRALETPEPGGSTASPAPPPADSRAVGEDALSDGDAVEPGESTEDGEVAAADGVGEDAAEAVAPAPTPEPFWSPPGARSS